MTAMSECMLLLTENDPRYTTTNLTKSGRRIVWPKAQSAQLNFAITPGIFALGIEFRVDRVAKLKAVRDQARADAERAEGAIERFGPTITPQALKTFARQARRACGPNQAATVATARSRSATNSTPKSSHHGVEKRAPAHARRCLKRENGRVLECRVLYRSGAPSLT